MKYKITTRLTVVGEVDLKNTVQLITKAGQDYIILDSALSSIFPPVRSYTIAVIELDEKVVATESECSSTETSTDNTPLNSDEIETGDKSGANGIEFESLGGAANCTTSDGDDVSIALGVAMSDLINYLQESDYITNYMSERCPEYKRGSATALVKLISMLPSYISDMVKRVHSLDENLK